MQLVPLELLAPARTADIGITAIDCGADAVYIAGPAFGARAAAGNAVEDIARLCRHAHLYGAKIHATVNTLLQGDEIDQAVRLMWALYEAGVDVFIVQDLALLSQELPPVELHASTQTAIRTPERARALEALGFSRLVLERQLSLEEIRAIRAAVGCELEFFIHGALCVGYSGECYLSQALTGRSANRGVCAQPCRSRYDLVDADGRVLVRDRPLLSPRDLRFDRLLPDLVEAGVTAFKIEGRLKNASYVKNVVRHYRGVMDQFIASAGAPLRSDGLLPSQKNARSTDHHPLHSASVMPSATTTVMPGLTTPVMPGLTGHLYTRASAGRLEGGFTPDPDRTFGRGWTEAFLEGRGGKMASEDAAKSLGEFIGRIQSVRGREIVITGDRPLANGDGLSFVADGREPVGARVEVAQGTRVTLRETAGLVPGMRVYRNYDIRFERELEKNLPRRVLDVALRWHSQDGETRVTATSQGVTVEKRFVDDAPVAEKPAAALEALRRQLGKNSGPFAFAVDTIQVDPPRFYPASFLNGIRRELATTLEDRLASRPRTEVPHTPLPASGPDAPALLNRSTLALPDELLRSRYCIRRELGMCPRCPVKPGMTEVAKAPIEPLYLVNQGNRLRLAFDCKNCEMIVVAPK